MKDAWEETFIKHGQFIKRIFDHTRKIIPRFHFSDDKIGNLSIEEMKEFCNKKIKEYLNEERRDISDIMEDS